MMKEIRDAVGFPSIEQINKFFDKHIKNETFEVLEKLSEHESVIGVYIYPHLTGKKRVAIELSSGRQIEGEAFVSLADAVKSAQDRLTEHFEADYETL